MKCQHFFEMVRCRLRNKDPRVLYPNNKNILILAKSPSPTTKKRNIKSKKGCPIRQTSVAVIKPPKASSEPPLELPIDATYLE